MAEKKPAPAEKITAAILGAGSTFALTRIPVRGTDLRLEVIRRKSRLIEPLVSGGLLAFPKGTSIALDLADKQRFAKAFGQDAIRTIPVNEVIGKAKSLRGIKARLQHAVGNDFIIKPRGGAIQRVSEFTNPENLARRLTRVTKQSKKLLLQPNIGIQKEFRATVSAGKVTSLTSRRLPFTQSGFGAILPIINLKERTAVKGFVESAIKRSTIDPAKTGIVGFDVARTRKGLKLIEANVGPGDLFNPLKNVKAKARLLGRLPLGAAVGLSLIAGAVAVAAISKRKRKVIFRRIRGRVVPIRVKN